MAPENEGKPPAAIMGGKTEVNVDELLDIEQLMVKIQTQMEGICSSDMMTTLSFDGEVKSEYPSNCRPDALRVLTNKHDNVKIMNELALLKLRNIIPRQKTSVEDVSTNLNLKRSRPLSPLHVPRVSSINSSVDSKVGVLGTEGSNSPRGAQSTNFDLPSPPTVDMLPLKFIRTGDNTKAPFQKPSTIFMPTAKLGGVGLPILEAPIVPLTLELADVAPSTAPTGGTASKPSSPKKRPNRSRRERNRTRSKVPVMPEPVMQRLMPGDTNKIPEDGFLWRKYGNKPIKTASYKRGYYKCRHFKEVKCNATKIVQQTNNDPTTFSVHYKGEHTCNQRGNLNGANNGSQIGGNDSASLADQVNETLNLGDPRSPVEEKDDVLDGMDWPRDDDSDSGSDDLFPSSQEGEEAVDLFPSSREGEGDEAVESVSATPAAGELEQPASPLINFEMSSIGNLNGDSLPSEMSEMSVETTSPWCDTLSTPGGDFKVKYQDNCPTDACSQDIDQNGLLLDLIHGGLMGDNPSIHDINYWCHDLDSSYSFTDSLHF